MKRFSLWLDEAPLGTLILIAIGVAILLGATLTYLAYLLADGVPIHPVLMWEARIGSSELSALTRIGFGGAALIVGAGAAVIAFRNQRIREQAHARDEARRQQDRFVSASTQIGDDNATVRIAGVYAMSLLASELADSGFRQQCVDVLCAYLRMPLRMISDSNPEYGSALTVDPQDEFVREAIQTSLRRHLDGSTGARWLDVDLDLRGARLVNFTLDNVTVRNLTLSGARFVGDLFMQHARVTKQTDCRNVTFEGNAFFAGSQFDGRARFYGSTFNNSASFVNCFFGDLAWFYDCTFAGPAGFGKTVFVAAAGFERTRFEGKAGFLQTVFRGEARFRETEFEGITRFRKTHFAKQADFVRAKFEGRLSFSGHDFRGSSSFIGATKGGLPWDGPNPDRSVLAPPHRPSGLMDT